MPHPTMPALDATPADDASFIDTLRQIVSFCALDDASPYGLPYAPADYRDAFLDYAAE